MRVAVDAMGGDRGPSVIVPGAIAGARAFGVELLLVGRESELAAEVGRHDTTAVVVEVVDAPDTIAMDEHPALAARRKTQSSIHVALAEVHAGRAGATVSAGNSGAVMAAALMLLGRAPGVERPAIASILPSASGRTLMLDLGAVTDPKPHQLLQFALMGHVYAQRLFGVERPRIALLSNGEEPTKGNQLVQEVYPLLAAEPSFDFVGNIEGKDLFDGAVDVVVTDGFTGNVALKVAEGTASLITGALREELTRSLPRKLLALPLRPAFREVRRRLDYSEFGGAPLLGVRGAVVIAHGRSDERAIMNAIGAGKRTAEQRLDEAIAAALLRAQSPGPPDSRQPIREATASRPADEPEAGR
jgi:phosphate acyltransferase